ncbi:MAG: hypothetical protein ACKODS_06460 [Methylophilaceae bacterium]
MSRKKNVTSAPYKDKGTPKNRAVKILVTEEEYQALEIIAKDWNISLALAVRIMIGISTSISNIWDFFNNPSGHETIKKAIPGMEIAEFNWRMVTLRRFQKYWQPTEPPEPNVDK